MKMTMHINESLLARVMREYGYATKTEAVEMALRELDRRARLREFGKNGMGLTPEELAEAVDPTYDPGDLSSYDPLGVRTTSKVAEDSASYGK